MTTLITAAKETRRTNNLYTLGSLSKDDGGGNENDKKATGLVQQHNSFARRSRLLSRRCKMEVPNFTFFFLRTGTQDNNFPFLFLNFDTVL